MRFADFDPARVDAALPPIPEPRPIVHVWTERQWRTHWEREKKWMHLAAAGIYEWEPVPVIYVRGGSYTRLLDLTYAHEQGHHLWRFGFGKWERQWWSRWARGNPRLVPLRRNPEHWSEETFAEAFGRYFTGRRVHAGTARRLREVCGLPCGEARLPGLFVETARPSVDAQVVMEW